MGRGFGRQGGQGDDGVAAVVHAEAHQPEQDRAEDAGDRAPRVHRHQDAKAVDAGEVEHQDRGGPSGPSGGNNNSGGPGGGSNSGGGGGNPSGGSSAGRHSQGLLGDVAKAIGPGNAQSIPLPLLVLGGLALLLLLTAAATWLARRLQARRVTPAPAVAKRR